MEKKFGWRRLLALLLAVSMVFSSQAFTALADGIALIDDPNPIKIDTTYNLAEHPDWIQKWDPGTQTGSHVSIQNSTNKLEQFLPADYIEGTKDYPEFVVKDGYGVSVDVYWTVPDEGPYSPVKDGTIFKYQLPASITFGVDQKFKVYDSNGTQIGWATVVTVDETSWVTVELEFPNGQSELREFSAHFSLWGTMELEGRKKDEKVTLEFPEIGTRDVTVAEDVSSERLGFTVSKGLANYNGRLYGWGYDGNLESAAHYSEQTGLIDEIWYMVQVTAETTNEGLLQHLYFDDEITNAWNGKGENNPKEYFTIDADRAQIVNFWKESEKSLQLNASFYENLEADVVTTEDGKTRFEFDLSKLAELDVDLNGEEEGNGLEPGLAPGDYIIIIYPVIVDPEFWTDIPSGQTSESMVELSGVYGAENTITVENEAGDTNTAKTNWSMQKEWLNKKGSVKMIDGKPYVHYEIYVYPTVSNTLAGWLLEDDMEGQSYYEYQDGVHIEFYDQTNTCIKEVVLKDEIDKVKGHWKYTVPDEVNDRRLVRGDYLLISYDVLYDENLSEKDERLRNSIRMSIHGYGPKPVGIESSYYSLDKKSLSKAEDVAKAAKLGESPLEWKTVIGSITNTAGEVAGGQENAVIKDGSTFWDVLTSSGPNHYFTQTDIDGITLWSGEDEDNRTEVKKGTDYDVYSAASITEEGNYTFCEPGENCKGFFIKFKNDVPAPVTVEYTSHSAKWDSVESATYTNTSSFHPAEAGSTMSDAASLAFNGNDYLAKLPHGINYEKGQAQWYFLLNQKNNLKFRLDGESYTIEDVMPKGHKFAAAYVAPYRNGSLEIDYDDSDWWENHKIDKVEVTDTEEGQKAVIDVTKYLQCQQSGDMGSLPGGDFQSGDVIAIYVVTNIDKDVLLSNTTQTLQNEGYFRCGNDVLTHTATSQELVSKVLEKTHGKVDSEAKQLTYTVTVNEQGSKLTDSDGGEVTVVDTLQEGLRFPEDAKETVEVEIFFNGNWVNLKTLPQEHQNSVEIEIEGNTLTLIYHDQGLPIRFTYVTELTGEGLTHVVNNVNVNVSTDINVSTSSDDSVTIVGGTAGADGTNSIQIKKVSAEDPDKGLAGAEFDLFRFEEIGEGEWGWKPFESFTTADGGIWNGHKFTTNTLFKLVETTAPSGYGKAEDYYFVIQGTSEDDLDEQEKTEMAGREFLTVNPTEGIVISDPVAGSLTVTKTVQSNGVLDREANLSFEVALFEDEAGTMPVEGQKKTVTVTNGVGSVKFDDLTVGKTYYVFEVDESGKPVGDGYDYKVTGSGQSVTIERNDVNNKAEIINNKVEEGSIEVTKVLKYNGVVDTETDATFYVALFADTVSDEPLSVVKPIEIRKGGSGSGTAKFENLEVGKTYYVYETDISGKKVSGSEGYEYTVTGEGGLLIEHGDANKKVTITNDRMTGDITVTKTLKYNGETDLETEASFMVALYSDAAGEIRVEGQEPKTVTVEKGTGSVKFENLTVGETYYVFELDEDGNPAGKGYGYEVTGSGTGVTITKEDLHKSVSIENNKVETGSLTVTKTVLHNNAIDTEANMSFYVALFSDAAGTEMVSGPQTVEVTAGTGEVTFEDLTVGNTYYVFEVNADGIPVGEGFDYDVTYENQEVTIGRNDLNKTASITNSIDTANGELPVGAVRKVLNGAELTAGQFTFTLRNSDTGEVLQTVSNGADGSVTFEPIRYTMEDVGKTYTYEVTESAADAAGITTDTRVYTIRVTGISDNGDGTLKVDYTREYNGEPLEEDDVVTFINTFAGSVTLNKVSTDGTRLPGAVFQLYAQNADGSWGVYTGTNPTGTYTTDISGVVTVPNLPANNYYFVETQAPAGFTADPNARYEFTISAENTSATVGVNVSLTVTNQPEPQEGQLVVTKELTNNGELWAAENATFYVALYSDAALTNRVSDIQAIEFRNASASSVTFTGLTNGQTYYVAEVDAAGNVLNNAGGVTSGEDIFTVNFMNGNEVTIVEGEGTRTVFFRNEFMTIPEDYYREGELTVTKSLLGSDGAAKDSDETFYAGIFADAEFTTLSDQVSQNVIPLKMNGKSGAGNTVQVAIAPDAPQTLYVTETDENGKPVDGAVLFRYAINVENGTVTLDEANTAATVAITNIEDEEKYYREGELTITKRLLGVDGNPKNSSETFYAGIFADANHTTLSDQVSQNIVPLALGGQSSVSALVKVAIMPGDVQTLYVTEVDANGIPVENAASFRYDVTVEGATVTMDEDTVTASVTITNKESTAEEQSETTTTSVKTGDETPIIPFAIAFAVAAAALLIIGFKRRKRKDAE